MIDARLHELWNAFHAPGSPLGRARELGSLYAPRERPQLVVCDPALVAHASPLRLRFGGDTDWRVSILAADGRVVAAMAEIVSPWSSSWPTSWPRTFAFERAAGASTERWEVTCDGADLHERSVDRRGKISTKTTRTGGPLAALGKLRARIETKRRGGFVEVIGPATPPPRWELATCDDGADSFAVDHAAAIITDASSAASFARSPALRAQLERAAQGPPGCAQLGDGAASCDVAWFGSGRGDGRYRAHWGLTGARPICLIVPFLA